MNPDRRRELLEVQRRIREALGADPMRRYRIPTRPTLWQRILRSLAAFCQPQRRTRR
jgi:hypothetical protein